MRRVLPDRAQRPANSGESVTMQLGQTGVTPWSDPGLTPSEDTEDEEGY
jgi:hypothetical protein